MNEHELHEAIKELVKADVGRIPIIVRAISAGVEETIANHSKLRVDAESALLLAYNEISPKRQASNSPSMVVIKKRLMDSGMFNGTKMAEQFSLEIGPQMELDNEI